MQQGKGKCTIAKTETRIESKKGEQGIKFQNSAMTEDEKAAKIEELKAALAAKLEAGEITQDEYDAKIVDIDAGIFKFAGRGIKKDMHKVTNDRTGVTT